MSPRHGQITRAWVVLTFVLAILASGCDRGDPPANNKARRTASQQPAPSGTEGHTDAIAAAPAAGENDLTLSTASQRIARQVEAVIKEHREKLRRLGLAAERLELALRFEGGANPKCVLMTQRLAAALTEALGRIEGVQLTDGSGPSGPGRIEMDARITTDFESPFSEVRCECALRAGDAVSRQFRDRFDSEALVRIASGADEPLVVQAVKGDLAMEFEVKPGRWFTIPRGQYSRLAVKSGGRSWSPPSMTVGIQNIYDIRMLAAPAAPEAGPAPGAPAMPRPLLTPPEASDGSPGLTITTPGQGQEVSRAAVVRGKAHGLAQAKVRVFVIDIDGENVRYPQDNQCAATREWSVGRCYFGRPGDVDRGVHFKIVAVATMPDGRTVESPGVTVRRQ